MTALQGIFVMEGTLEGRGQQRSPPKHSTPIEATVSD